MSNRRRPQLKQEVNIKMSHYAVRPRDDVSVSEAPL